MKLYEYACYFIPTKEQEEAGRKPVILKIDHILETDEETVRRRVIREIPKSYEDVLSQVKIDIRTF